MKTIQHFFFFALFLFSASAVFGKSLPVAAENEAVLNAEKIKITLCVGGRNWKACLTIETKAAIRGTNLTAQGTINEATKTLTITGLPNELKGQAIQIVDDVTFTRTNTVKGKSVEESITLKKGAFKVGQNGSFAMPVKQVLANNK